MIAIHPHAQARLEERGATAAEIIATVERGEQFPAKFGRTGFALAFVGDCVWRGRSFDRKRVEAYAAPSNGERLVITVIVKFGRAG